MTKKPNMLILNILAVSLGVLALKKADSDYWTCKTEKERAVNFLLTFSLMALIGVNAGLTFLEISTIVTKQ